MNRGLLVAALLVIGVITSNAQDVYVIGGTDLQHHLTTVTNPRTGKSAQLYGFNDEQGVVLVGQEDLDRVDKCVKDSRKIRDQALLQKFCMETAIGYYGKESRITRWFFRSAYYNAINNR